MATTTNYGWDTPDDTDLVKDGALAMRDLGQDIDTSLYSITNGENVGLVHLNTTTFTSQTTINFNSVFTADYDNYQIEFSNLLGSTAADVFMQMRTGTTNTGGTAYSFSRIFGNYTSGITGAGGTLQSAWTTGMVVQDSGRSGAQITVFNPFLSQLTSYTANSADTRSAGAVGLTMSGGVLANTTSYDGFSITSVASITGTISVFGFRK